jgi:hypothetical protein
MNDKTKQLSDTLLAVAGRIVTVKTRRPAKVKKSSPIHDQELVKESVISLRSGIEYNNTKKVIAGHETGEIEKKGLPDGWTKHNKVLYETAKGNFLLGFQPNSNPNAICESRYLLDGEEVEFFEIEDDLLASEKRKGETPKWLTLKPENITEINGDNKVLFSS